MAGGEPCSVALGLLSRVSLVFCPAGCALVSARRDPAVEPDLFKRKKRNLSRLSLPRCNKTIGIALRSDMTAK